MKLLLFAALSCVAAIVGAQAQSDVYVCTGADGAKEYRNTGATGGCRKMALPRAMPQQKRAGREAAATAADLPRADDSARRALVLQEELRAERKALAQLQADFNHGEPERRGDERNYARYQERVAGMKDDIARVERHIETLERELGRLR